MSSERTKLGLPVSLPFSVLSVSLFVFSVLCLSVSAAEDADNGAVSVAVDPDAATADITVRAPGGKVAWVDILCGIARARGYDDTALQGVLPASIEAKSMDLTSRWTRTALVAMNMALSPGLRLSAEPPPGGKGEWVFHVRMDRRALLATQRRLKEKLRRACIRLVPSRRIRKTDFRLELEDGWQDAPPGRPLVIVVPGLNAVPEQAAAFTALLAEQGLPWGVLRFPNDQPVARSAGLLSRELRRVAGLQPDRAVALIGVSMGGLVSREVVENPRLDPGNVTRLILVAVPNHGSRLAEFAFGLELAEHVAQRRDRSAAQRLYDAVEDGLGEAYDNLTPGSAFLERLNARPRNPRVRYSLFLGDAALLSDGEVQMLREKLQRAGQKNRFVRFLGPRLDAALADLDEIKYGKGDGAVSVARGRLEGVDDVVILPFRHSFLDEEAVTEGERELQRQVLDRLTRGGPDPAADAPPPL